MKNVKALLVDTSNNRLILNKQQLDKNILVKNKKLSMIVGRNNSNQPVIVELCEIETIN